MKFRRLWFVVGILTVLLLAAGWLGALWLGPTVVAQAEVQLSRILQTQIRLGQLRTLLPWQVTIGPVSIATPQEADLLKAPEVALSFNLVSYVFGRGADASLVVTEPVIRLRRDREGRFNLPQFAADAAQSSGTVDKLLRKVEVKNGTFIYDDRVLGGKPVTFTNLVVGADFDAKGVRYDLRLASGRGEVQAEGQTDLNTFKTRIDAVLKQLPAAELSQALNLGDLSVRKGTADGTLRIELANLQSDIRATGPVRLTGGELVLRPYKAALTVLDVNGQLNWPRLALSRIRGELAGSTVQGTGRFDLPEQLGLNVEVTGPVERLARAFVSPPLALGGRTRTQLVAQIPLARVENLTARGEVVALVPLKVDRLVLNNFRSGVSLAKSKVTAPFNFNVAGGAVNGTARVQLVAAAQPIVEVDATGRSLVAESIAERYGEKIPAVERTGRLDFKARITGPGDRLALTADFVQRDGRLAGRTFGSTGTVALVGQQLTLSNTLVQIAEARIRASGQAILNGPRLFTARLDLESVPLALVSDTLGGDANGQIALSGNLQQGIASLEGDGDLSVPRPTVSGQTLPPVRTVFRLQDETIRLDRFTSGGLAVTGTLNPNLTSSGPLLKTANLRIALDDFDLRSLPLPVTTSGFVSGRGTFVGNLQDPDLNLQVNVRDGAVGKYQAPFLSGPVRLKDDLITVRLNGLDQNWLARATIEPAGIRLATLNIESGTTRVVAQNGFFDFNRGLTRLSARVEDLDLGKLDLEPIGPLRTINGRTTASVEIARGANGLEGSLDVTLRRGRLNGFVLGQTNLRVRLRNNQLSIAPTALSIENSRYEVSGRVGLGLDDPLDLSVRAVDGRLEQGVRLLGLYSLSSLISPPRGALGRAQDLGINNVGGAALPLQQLLDVYQQASDVVLARLDAMSRSVIPDDLRQLQGRFDLTASLKGTRRSPVAAFVFAGSDWQWQQWRLDSIAARGGYQNGNLTLAAAQASYAERTGELTGTLSLAGTQDARLAVRNFPVELVEPLLPSGVQVSGDLNTTAVLSGTLRSPVVSAQVGITALAVNGREVDPVRTELTVRNGRAALNATAIGIDNRGVELTGSVPVPFLNPDDPGLAVDVKLAGENLPLLNLVTDQLVWRPATGQAAISVRGTYADPLIEGTVDFRDTSIQIPRLKTTLVLDQFLASFDRRRLLLDRLAGSLGGAAISGDGALALGRASDSTLSLRIGGNILLPDLYRGGVEGELIVAGAVIAPRVGGNLSVNPGDLLLTLQDFQALAAAPNVRAVGTSEAGLPTGLPIVFDNLEVRVGPQFRVEVSALSARLDGELAINGPLDELRIDGAINVPQGTVTIGAALFRLDTSRLNGLFFDGDLDPRLDLRVEARVSEFRSTGVARLDSFGLRNSSVNLDQGNLGRIEKIEVRADVTGTARKPIIDLRSSPPRDKTEILALIGGLGGGAGSLLTGLIPAVGSGLLRPVEQGLASVLGLDELRIDFASQVASATPQNFGVGLGVEAIKDLSPAVSVSIFRNISDNIQPTLFGLRYRINEQFVTRLSTSERSDSLGISVQFETRF